ncbi:MAG: hypothetical protein JO361_00265 [Gammaproteobacteria bacterium]|nr:hypothetical protein [Gammaproteobacteria bacterium]
MRLAIAISMVLAAGVTSVGIAQQGSGHGPPKAPVIVVPIPVPLPTTQTPAGNAPKLTPSGWQ